MNTLYKLPNFKNLLPAYPAQAINRADVDHKGSLLEAQLKNFGVGGAVVEIHPGPVITQYEIRLAKGQKASEVEKIATDLAIALKAISTHGLHYFQFVKTIVVSAAIKFHDNRV